MRAQRQRVQAYLTTDLHDQLVGECAALRTSVSAYITAAVRERLDGLGDKKSLFNRLDRVSRGLEHVDRDVELLSETFAIFVRVWYAHNPSVPDEAKQAARAVGDSRFERFIRHAAEQWNSGHRFIDHFPPEFNADDDEKDAVPERLPRGDGSR
jgi:hypothetical protein